MIIIIHRTVTLDCHRRNGNLSMAWTEVKKAYDPVDHGWLQLEDMMILKKIPCLIVKEGREVK